MMPIKVLITLGTRPEGIKLAPLILLLQEDPGFDVTVCSTAQHREMLDDVLDFFNIRPDHDLGVMLKNQDLFHITTAVLAGMGDILAATKPDWVVVQGDTSTTFATALAAFYAGVKVSHVEAGLRSGDPRNPFPEETNRVLVSRLASLHFAPTESAASNLFDEGINPASVLVTGNTVIDALHYTKARTAVSADPCHQWAPARRMLITIHRRENFSNGVRAVCDAVRSLADEMPDWEFVWPVHPNPRIHDIVHANLSSIPNVHLVEPLRYDHFIALLSATALILTDSGGLQEEAASMGIPTLIARDYTERVEALREGCAEMVEIKADTIIARLRHYMLSVDRPGCKPSNAFGDGTASVRIRDAIKRHTTLTNND